MTDNSDPTTAETAAELASVQSKMDQLASLIPGLRAKQAAAADRERRKDVQALRERIEPTLGAEADTIRTAMRTLEKATADVLVAGNQRNARIHGDVTAMTKVGIAAHPQGDAPMPSPEFAGLGFTRRSDDVSIVVDLRHEHVIDPARLVDLAVSAGRRVAAGSDPDPFPVLDDLVRTTPTGPEKRYFLAEVGDQHQVCAFDAAQVDSWAAYQHARFVAEITEEQAWRIGWNLARVEPRTAGGVEVTSVDPGR